MKLEEKIRQAQEEMKEKQLDGWLLYDFRRQNPIALDFLKIPQDTMLTRRVFYWIPKEGDPVKVVSAIEPHVVSHIPGITIEYMSWQELEDSLKNLLKGSKVIAMEYSPLARCPYISKVDAGTADLIRSFGVDIASSDSLVQQNNILDDTKIQTHKKAAAALDKIVQTTWNHLAQCLKNKTRITEYDVALFIQNELNQKGLVTDGQPICAVNENSANPHYSPSNKGCKEINPNNFILIDLWAKETGGDTIYADISRVAVAAKSPTTRQTQIFNLVKQARDLATEAVKEAFQEKREISGYDVDRVARSFIEKAGFGAHFTHRLGHNIDTHDHGSGTHLDSLETKDTRPLVAGTCFSIEPGIYLPGEFGVRLEYDICIDKKGKLEITGGIQENIETIF